MIWHFKPNPKFDLQEIDEVQVCVHHQAHNLVFIAIYIYSYKNKIVIYYSYIYIYIYITIKTSTNIVLYAKGYGTNYDAMKKYLRCTFLIDLGCMLAHFIARIKFSFLTLVIIFGLCFYKSLGSYLWFTLNFT